MDESVYYYCMASLTSVSRSGVAKRKKTKKRPIVAVATNTDGSFKAPLLFVGAARKPWCFGAHTTAELDFDYTNATKGWMTTQLFCTWFKRFYVHLSNVQKQELQDHSAPTPSMTQRELADQAVTTFRPAHPPSRMTLH